MVFTHAEHLNVPHNNHVVAFFVEDRIADNFIRVCVVSPQQEFHTLLDAFRGIAQTFAGGVVTALGQKFANQVADFHTYASISRAA